MGVIEARLDEDVVDTRTAAVMLGCSERTVRRLFEDGELPGFRLTPRGISRLRFRRRDVEEIRARTLEGVAA